MLQRLLYHYPTNQAADNMYMPVVTSHLTLKNNGPDPRYFLNSPAHMSANNQISWGKNISQISVD